MTDPMLLTKIIDTNCHSLKKYMAFLKQQINIIVINSPSSRYRDHDPFLCVPSAKSQSQFN